MFRSVLTLTMTNQNAGGKIYYTTNGTDPRVYGSGAVLFGALTYTNGIPLVLNSQHDCQGARAQRHLERASRKGISPLRCSGFRFASPN